MDMKEQLCGSVHQARPGSCGWKWCSLQKHRFMRGWEVRITHVPQSRDALTRAKVAKVAKNGKGMFFIYL